MIKLKVGFLDLRPFNEDDEFYFEIVTAKSKTQLICTSRLVSRDVTMRSNFVDFVLLLYKDTKSKSLQIHRNTKHCAAAANVMKGM
jgi:hypothetical protein